MTGSDDVPAMHAAVPEDGDGARIVAYRRSLRASRTRRAAATLRRRRVLRSRGSMLVATAGLLLGSAGAIAQQDAASGGGTSKDMIAAAQRALGIAADGIVGPQTRGATKRFQRRNRLAVDGVLGPRTLAALGIDANAFVAGARLRTSAVDPVLERIAECESGGDPTAVSADGRYHGKYQFSLQTWRELGGTGNPAHADEAEQDRIAAVLLKRAGTAPWPSCA
jgi:hypothetical protein